MYGQSNVTKKKHKKLETTKKKIFYKSIKLYDLND